ncbi:MAG: hypothetical protein ACTS1Z_15515 [Parasphingopyxis sp.]|uniref:hypothetical protein n=1 Tax=Parasphingopyxis sp. TaxID=1920299 RepID=UPI003FA0C8D3
MSENSENELRLIKAEIIKEEIRKDDDFSFSIFKWCLASLVIVNSGTLFSLSRMEIIQSPNFLSIASPFAASLFLSIMSGIIMCITYSISASRMRSRLWQDNFDQYESFTKFYSSLKPGTGLFLIGALLLIFSVSAFIYGCFSLAAVLNAS